MKKVILSVILVAGVLFSIYSIYRLISVYDTYQLGMEQFHDLEQKVILGNNTGFTYSALSMYKEPIARQAKMLMLKYLIFAVLSIITMSLSIIKLIHIPNKTAIKEEYVYTEEDIGLMRDYYNERENKIHEYYKNILHNSEEQPYRDALKYMDDYIEACKNAINKKYGFELEQDSGNLRESIIERCEELEEEDNFYQFIKNESEEI